MHFAKNYLKAVGSIDDKVKVSAWSARFNLIGEQHRTEHRGGRSDNVQ